MPILHRYILKELVRVFLLALIAFTAVFVVAGLVHEANQQGLGVMQILYMIPFAVPAWLPFAIPATMLLSVTFVYGRLSADNEVMAAKAAGINVLYLLMPAFGLGLAMSVVTYFLFDRVIPVANLHMRTMLVENVEDVVYAVLRRDGMIKGNGMPYEIYVPRVAGKKLITPIFKHRGSDGAYDLIVSAEEASLRFDLANRQVIVHMYNAAVTDGKGGRLETRHEKIFEIPLPEIAKVDRGFRDMTMRDLGERQVVVRQATEQLCGKWAFNALGPLGRGQLAQTQWSGLVGIVSRSRDHQRELLRLECEPHLRRAISFGCLAFVILGCPVAIWFQRGDYLSAFISCFLPIILLYYPLVMFGFNLSKEGLLPAVTLWFANVMLVGLGALVFRPVLKY